MRKSSRARRSLYVVNDNRYIPDRIAGGNDISFEGDKRVFRHPENGGHIARLPVAIEYVTKLRGGPMTLCCARAPYCEHFRGVM